MEEPRKRFAAMMSGLDIHYDLGERHALLGRRMPDPDLVTAAGPPRGLADALAFGSVLPARNVNELSHSENRDSGSTR